MSLAGNKCRVEKRTIISPVRVETYLPPTLPPNPSINLDGLDVKLAEVHLVGAAG